MKKLLLILFCLPLLYSCNSNRNLENDTKQEVKDYSIVQDSIVISKKTVKDSLDKHNSLVLDFPVYSDSIIYSGCEELLSKTPKRFYFSIYEDTIINFNTIDSRLSIKLKFNWLYDNKAYDKEGYPICSKQKGVVSIDILEEGHIISNINLQDIFMVRAFQEKDIKSDRYGEIVRDDIKMEDVNMDSYLDFIFREDCGKSCNYLYYLYNPITNIFELHEKYNIERPIYIDCNKQIIYSYLDGDMYRSLYVAYKFKDNKLVTYQTRESIFESDYYITKYTDSAGNLISADTTYKN